MVRILPALCRSSVAESEADLTVLFLPQGIGNAYSHHVPVLYFATVHHSALLSGDGDIHPGPATAPSRTLQRRRFPHLLQLLSLRQDQPRRCTKGMAARLVSARA